MDSTFYQRFTLLSFVGSSLVAIAHFYTSKWGSERYLFKHSHTLALESLDLQHKTEKYFDLLKRYLVVYFLMNAADWLKAPYSIELYKTVAKHSRPQIAILFIFGFLVSLILGTVAGAIADNYGRKKLALIFSACYIISTLSYFTTSFTSHLFGRLFMGIGNSLLFCVFEAWIVGECKLMSCSLPALGLIFGLSTLGNAYVAIGTGILGHIAVHKFSFILMPFIASLFLLVYGGWYITQNWTENYGKRQSDIITNFFAALSVVLNDRRVLLLGVAQIVIEAVNLTFHYLWADMFRGSPSIVYIFSSFMIYISIGAIAFLYMLQLGISDFQIIFFALALAAINFIMVFIFQGYAKILFVLFCVFEFCMGIIIPTSAYMRTKYVPEEYKSLIISIYRIPINLVMILLLIFISWMPFSISYLLCALELLFALLVHIYIQRKLLEPGSERFFIDQ